jgi:hypothetical protein
LKPMANYTYSYILRLYSSVKKIWSHISGDVGLLPGDQASWRSFAHQRGEGGGREVKDRTGEEENGQKGGEERGEEGGKEGGEEGGEEGRKEGGEEGRS